jgi:predicted RND superfamily exporter protein
MQRLARISLSHPVATLTALAALTALLGIGALRVETDVGYRSLLGREHAAIARFDAFLERFGGGFPVVAVWSCEETARCESVFDDDALRMAAQVAEALASEPSIRGVESPATTPLLVPDANGPILRRFVEAGRLAPDRSWLAERALRDSLWPRALVDAEGRVGAIAIEVASAEAGEGAAAYAALDAALTPHERAGYRFHRVGGPVEFVVAGGELHADTARLVPLMTALIGAVLLALFRSPALAGIALLTAGTSVLWAFGVMGWLGWPQNAVTQALAPLLLVIGVCNAIHVLARYASDAAQHPLRDRAALLVAVAGDVGRPCAATSLTTAGGVASFVSSDLESFARFGAIAALGTLGALLLTFTLLPILSAAGGRAARSALRASAAWERLVGRIAAFSARRAAWILAFTALLSVIFAFGFAQLRVDASFEDLYGEDSRVVRWARFVGEHLRRPDSLEVELAAPPGARVEDSPTLAVVDDVAKSLAGVDGLGPVRSVADPISLVHQLVSGNDPFWYRLPARAADTREILDLLAERDPDALARWLDADALRFRVSVESGKPPQAEMRRIFAEVDALLAARLPPGWSASLTGPLAMVHEMVEEIQRTQLESFLIAGSVVLVLAAIFLGSARGALLAAVPTLLGCRRAARGPRRRHHIRSTGDRILHAHRLVVEDNLELRRALRDLHHRGAGRGARRAARVGARDFEASRR